MDRRAEKRIEGNKIVQSNPMELQVISDGNLPSELDVNETKTQLRIFLVAQAKRELVRVVKLTETLDKLQDVYADKVTEYINTHDSEALVKYMPMMIETITKCLERSNSIISQVVGNDKIMNFQFINAEQTNNLNVVKQSDSILNLEEASSRSKVREVVELMLEELEGIVDDTEIKEIAEEGDN